MTRILTASSVLNPRRPKTYPAGRVCAHDGCSQVLSVYNPDPWCGLHQPEPDMRYCGYDVRVCLACVEAVMVNKKRPQRVCGKCGAAREVTPMYGSAGE